MSVEQTKMAKKIKSKKKGSSTKAEKLKKPPRTRSDYTKDISSQDRIMDTLAKLLAGYSECVAVASIGGELCIAANEFNLGTQTTGKNRSYQSILNIVNFFLPIASKPPEVGAAASSTGTGGSSSAAAAAGDNNPVGRKNKKLHLRKLPQMEYQLRH